MHADVIIIRLIFTGILVAAGYVLRPVGGNPWISAAVGALIAVCIILFELRIRRATLKTLIGAAVGSIMGIVGAYLIGSLISRQESMAVAPEVKTFTTLALTFFMAYVGLMVGAAKGDYLDLSALGGIFSDKASRRDLKILDTSVIIDGRIADVAETDFPSVREVDLKLIELGKQLDAVIVTNDFNLNKVAQLRGVNVLNINELANALKPVVLPGEAMRVFILKEGKEYNQGVAYLDDGTMVVVDNARRLIGKNADIAVTSVLQTTAGKMIFGRLWEEPENGSPSGEHRINGSARRQSRDSRSGPLPVRITDTEPITEL